MFRIRKDWFGAHHAAIYGIKPGVHRAPIKNPNKLINRMLVLIRVAPLEVIKEFNINKLNIHLQPQPRSSRVNESILSISPTLVAEFLALSIALISSKWHG
jgi:hypothetical protein